MGVLKGLKELLRGMGITGKHLGRHAITIQYPEEKWEMPERSRGVVVLLSDKKTGELNCTSCMLCMKACPTSAITIDAPRGEDKKRHLKQFDLDNTICCFCGLCEDACNFCAIKMASAYYEMSVLDKGELLWDMKKLQEMGRDVPYVDTRKKKKKPAPKPTDKAGTDAAATPAAKAETDKPATDKPESPETEPEAPEVKPAPSVSPDPDETATEKTEDDTKPATGEEGQ